MERNRMEATITTALADRERVGVVWGFQGWNPLFVVKFLISRENCRK